LEDAVAVLREQLERSERGRGDAERRVDELRATIDELKAGQALMTDIHARELAVAQHDAQAGQQAAVELRQAEAERKARGLVARLRAAFAVPLDCATCRARSSSHCLSHSRPRSGGEADG
jgi:hypothetical protein